MQYCMKCSSSLDPFYNYCPYCGYDAPRGTIMPDAQPQKLTEGIYCVHCAKLNVKDGLFCADCGKHLYEKPEAPPCICPRCAKGNNLDAVYCYKCSENLTEWFAMRGSIAKELGWRGPFILHETLNDLYYHFIRKDRITLGRSENNDIVLPSGWVSGSHCLIDLKRRQIRDDNSTNGTFTNRKSDRLRKLSLDLLQEFNIAGVFTFTVIKKGRLFIIRLTAILDQEGVKREGQIDALNELRKHYFILIGGAGSIDIRKMDGEILTTDDERMEFFTVTVHEDGYFFSDEDRDIKDKLLLKKYNNLPVNWQFEFSE